MNASEELERIIKDNGDEVHPNGYYEIQINHLVNTILSKLPSLGFVRPEDVEIDEEKSWLFLWSLVVDTGRLREFSDAIASAKGLIKRKEEK